MQSHPLGGSLFLPLPSSDKEEAYLRNPETAYLVSNALLPS